MVSQIQVFSNYFICCQGLIACQSGILKYKQYTPRIKSPSQSVRKITNSQVSDFKRQKTRVSLTILMGALRKNLGVTFGDTSTFSFLYFSPALVVRAKCFCFFCHRSKKAMGGTDAEILI